MFLKIDAAGILLSCILALTILASGAVAIDNLIANPDFDAGTEGWNLGGLSGGAVADMSAVAGGLAGQCLFINIDAVGDAGYKPEIHSPNFAVEQDMVYTLAVWVKTEAGVERELNISFEQNHDPWDGPGETFTINDQWAEYYLTPVMPFSDPDMVVHFGTQQLMGDLWIDHIRVYQGDYVSDVASVSPADSLATKWGQIKSR